LVLFLLPFSLFTNLHLIHNYYQYANSFWLVLALGLSVSEMSKRVPRFLTVAAVLAILAAQIHTYSVKYFPSTRSQTTGALEAAKFLAANSNKQESLLVLGDDWSPEVAFLSGRRAVYIPNWLAPARAAAVFNKIRTSPETIFGSHPPAYFVVNSNRLASYSPELRKEIEEFLLQMGKSKTSKSTRIAEYEMFKIGAGEKGFRIEMAQSEKPQLDSAQTQTLFDSLAQKTLGNSFNIENRPMGIFIHPGGQPTEAVFDIAGKFRSVRLAGFITELPPSGLEDPKAGTAGVEIFVDGLSQGRRPVDRSTNQDFAVDLTNAKELRVVVDCANGTADWDHFYLGVAK
jgi:hypothetical protein